MRLQYQSQNTRDFFVTSEATGGFGQASVVFHQQSATDASFNFSNDRANEKLDLSANSAAFGLTSQLGLLNSLDFIYQTATHTPEMFGAKIQINGPNRNNTQKGDHSLSFLFMGGSSRYETVDGSNIVLPSNSQSTSDVNFKRTHTIVHFGILYGIRLEDYWLLYGHLSESKNSVHGEIDFDGSVLDGQQAKYSGITLNSTLGMSFESEKQRTSVHFELTLQDTKWSYTPREKFYLLALGMGYRF